LKHRIPTCGYLFEEAPQLPHIIKETVDFYRIPVKQLNEIKKGAGFITPEGELVPNNRLVRPAEPAKKYAYCSDTAYSEKIIPVIEGIDLLYHEATFCEEDLRRAKETAHSSARQAAIIAAKANVKKLMIGHFSARYPNTDILLQEAREIFPGTIVAKENLVCRV
jgi:ribonuclease Z